MYNNFVLRRKKKQRKESNYGGTNSNTYDICCEDRCHMMMNFIQNKRLLSLNSLFLARKSITLLP